MTFDVKPTQASASVVLYTKEERTLADPSDKQLPRGYRHSPGLGKATESTYRLEWGNNQVTLAPQGAKVSKPIHQFLFAP
jgi:hypothetical protein